MKIKHVIYTVLILGVIFVAATGTVSALLYNTARTVSTSSGASTAGLSCNDPAPIRGRGDCSSRTCSSGGKCSYVAPRGQGIQTGTCKCVTSSGATTGIKRIMSWSESTTTTTTLTPTTTTLGVGMANPASVYCEEKGGKLEIMEEKGGQRGDCVLNDGTRCDEWAYYRGECPQGATISTTTTLMSVTTTSTTTTLKVTTTTVRSTIGGILAGGITSTKLSCADPVHIRGRSDCLSRTCTSGGKCKYVPPRGQGIQEGTCKCVISGV